MKYGDYYDEIQCLTIQQLKDIFTEFGAWADDGCLRTGLLRELIETVSTRYTSSFHVASLGVQMQIYHLLASLYLEENV